jgi:hypothetical protein
MYAVSRLWPSCYRSKLRGEFRLSPTELITSSLDESMGQNGTPSVIVSHHAGDALAERQV